MTGLRLADPWLLLALLAIPALMAWRHWLGRAPLLLVPYASAWAGRGLTPPSRGWRTALLYAAIALTVLAAARPQRLDRREETLSRGYDLMLAIDLSTSMLAEDYHGPKGAMNRLEAIRPIIRAFITGRPNDRIGVVAFAGHAYTLAPLTTDHRWLARQVEALRIGLIEDGTAIGDGLGIALANLESSRKDERLIGRFVILLTDGANTAGELEPPQATAIARHRGVPVYTIGAGRNGMVPMPLLDDTGRRIGTRLQPSSVDTDALKTMATATGGRFFQAGDTKAVASAFAAIDAARKADFRVKTHVEVTELYHWPLLAALACLLLAAPALGRGRARPLAEAAS